jgi:predicted nuclease with TOPRIM domain
LPLFYIQGFKDDEEISTLQGQLRELYDENVKLKEMLEANRREMERIRQEYRESQEKVRRQNISVTLLQSRNCFPFKFPDKKVQETMFPLRGRFAKKPTYSGQEGSPD